MVQVGVQVPTLSSCWLLVLVLTQKNQLVFHWVASGSQSFALLCVLCVVAKAATKWSRLPNKAALGYLCANQQIPPGTGLVNYRMGGGGAVPCLTDEKVRAH